MINRYFGLPGCGKTTHIVKTAIEENTRINKGKSLYKRILTNVKFTLPEGEKSNIYYFTREDFGVYDMSNSLVLYDESENEFDSREYKNLGEHRRQLLLYHRQYKMNIYFYSQSADGVDKKIRNLTNNLYYMRKNVFTGKTKLIRIRPYINVPRKPKRETNEIYVNNDSTNITMRYYKVGFIEQLMTKLLLEPNICLKRWYPFFNSFNPPPLPIKEFELIC